MAFAFWVTYHYNIDIEMSRKPYPSSDAQGQTLLAEVWPIIKKVVKKKTRITDAMFEMESLQTLLARVCTTKECKEFGLQEPEDKYHDPNASKGGRKAKSSVESLEDE